MPDRSHPSLTGPSRSRGAQVGREAASRIPTGSPGESVASTALNEESELGLLFQGFVTNDIKVLESCL